MYALATIEREAIDFMVRNVSQYIASDTSRGIAVVASYLQQTLCVLRGFSVPIDALVRLHAENWLQLYDIAVTEGLSPKSRSCT